MKKPTRNYRYFTEMALDFFMCGYQLTDDNTEVTNIVASQDYEDWPDDMLLNEAYSLAANYRSVYQEGLSDAPPISPAFKQYLQDWLVHEYENFHDPISDMNNLSTVIDEVISAFLSTTENQSAGC